MTTRVHKGSYTGTAAALGEITNCVDADVVIVVISGLATETISVTGLVNTTVYSAAIRPIDLNTGAVASSSALGNGSYRFQQIGTQTLKFTKSGTSDTALINYVLHSQHD